VAWHVDEGRYGAVDLAGLNVALFGFSPGHMMQEKWKVALSTDERASQEHNQALATIFSGKGGGHLAALGPLIGEVLGVQSVPIEYRAEGNHRSVRVGTVAESERAHRPYRSRAACCGAWRRSAARSSAFADPRAAGKRTADARRPQRVDDRPSATPRSSPAIISGPRAAGRRSPDPTWPAAVKILDTDEPKTPRQAASRRKGKAGHLRTLPGGRRRGYLDAKLFSGLGANRWIHNAGSPAIRQN
jgi:hypothetical protein